jgi:ParB family chromosome partitioning protein
MSAQDLAVTGPRPAPPFAEALAAEYIEAAVARIIPDPGQPRKTFAPEGIRELAQNIEHVGLQNPVHLRPAGGELLMLISGARRVEAYKLLSRDRIPAFLHDGELPPRQLRLLQGSENLLREGVNPMEQAVFFQECLGEGTASDLARELGVAVSTITRALKLLSALPPDLQEAVRRGEIPGAFAQEICRAKDDEAKRCLARLYTSGQLKTGKELRAAVRNGNGNGAAAPAGFACTEAGVKVAVTLPAGSDLAAAEAALRAVLKDLKDHGARGLAHFVGFIERKAASRKAAERLQRAEDELEAHAS